MKDDGLDVGTYSNFSKYVKKEEEEVVEEAIKLATKIADENKKNVVIGAVLAIADKYVREQYISKLKEVIRMTRIGTSLFERPHPLLLENK